MERLNAATDCEQISNELRSELDTIANLLDTTACRPEDVISFFQQNPDLVDCVFPTSKVGDSVYPVYPGQYNPETQKLTRLGLQQLVEGTGKRNLKLDGYRTDIPKRRSHDGEHSITDEIEYQIDGACWKHREQKTISFDFDCMVFGETTDLPEAAIKWIVERFPGAVVSRGNRVRLTQTFRQSTELQKYLKELTQKSKIIWTLGSEAGSPAVEIGVNEGANQNFWGKHKSGTNYQVVFPEVMIELEVADFEELTVALEDAGWKRQREGDSSEGRLGIDEVCESNQYRDLIRTIKTLAKLCPKQIAVGSLISPDSREIILGNRRYTSPTDWTLTDPDNYVLPKGTRRHTEWRLFTDLAWAVALLEECGVAYETAEVEGYIRFMDDAIVPDNDWKRDQVYAGGRIPGTMRQCYGTRLESADCREEFVYTSLKQLIELLADSINTDDARRTAEEVIADYRSDWFVSAVAIKFGSDEWKNFVQNFKDKVELTDCEIALDANTVTGTDYFTFEVVNVLRELQKDFPQIKIVSGFYVDKLSEFYTETDCVRHRAIGDATRLLLLAQKKPQTAPDDELEVKADVCTDSLDVDGLFAEIMAEITDDTAIDWAREFGLSNEQREIYNELVSLNLDAEDYGERQVALGKKKTSDLNRALMLAFCVEKAPYFGSTVAREIMHYLMVLTMPGKSINDTQINNQISNLVKTAIDHCCKIGKRDLINQFDGTEFVVALKYDRDLVHHHDTRLISRYFESQGETLWWNEERCQIWRGNKPLGDVEEFRVVELEDCHNLKSRYKGDDFYLVCKAVADRSKRHPLKEYLVECGETVGDDESILADFATRIFKTTNPLYNTYMRNWFVDAVRLVFEPGTEIRSFLILTNGGKIGKTGFMKCLAPGRYNPTLTLPSYPDKDWELLLSRNWISNVDEIDQHIPNSPAAQAKFHARLKMLLTRTHQFIRRPYAKTDEEIARNYVLMATTNEITGIFPEADKGSDRLWIVDIDPLPFEGGLTFDFDWLTQNRDLLWGAAYRLYKSGYRTSLTNEDLIAQREASEPFTQVDTELERIRVVIEQNNWLTSCFTVAQVLEKLGYSPDQYKQHDKSVARSLATLGFVCGKPIRRFGSTPRKWYGHKIFNPERRESVVITPELKESIKKIWLEE